MGQRISSFIYASPSVPMNKRTTDNLIGLAFETAEQYIKEEKVYHGDMVVTSLREITSDTDMLTTDYNENRIDVRVNEGVITEIIGY